VATKVFINYRRDDSIGTAGRLHDRLAQTFGQKNIFMDVDSIPAGVDFVADLNSQVAACDVVLVVIGPNWLDAKDEAGRRRLDNPDDFVVIEIAAALARNIPVIPVLLDKARIPKASELPDPVKPLVRRNAVEILSTQFGRDAEVLIEKIREVLNGGTAAPRPWRGKAVVGTAAAAVLLLIGLSGYTFFRHLVEQRVQRAELRWEEERRAAEAEADRKVQQAEEQRLAAVKAEQERQERAAAEADAKRSADEAELQRLAAVKADQERQARAAAEAQENHKAYLAAIKEGGAAHSAGSFDKAIANFSEAIRLRPDDASAFNSRGNAYESKGDHDRAIADYTESIRLNPKNALAFNNRGIAYAHKGNYFRAIADYNEAIRLNPNYAVAFCNRGIARQKITKVSDNDDKVKARQLDASVCR
jgi:tetratricopeptide (TPR) repeat protein